MSDGLPKGWMFAQVQELTSNPKQDIVDGPFGSNLKASEYTNEGIPIVRLQNIDRNRFLDKNIKYVTRKKAAELSRHSFCTGDVIITKLGNPVGKACMVPAQFEYGIIVADVVRARIDERLAIGQFVIHAINSSTVASQLNIEVKGTTRPRVNLGHIRSLVLPIPPLNEQRRIVAKLEKLLGKVDACQKQLERIPLILKRFRQSVLAAACSGRLTEDWRAENGSKNDTWNDLKFRDLIKESSNGLSKRNSNEGEYTVVLRLSDFDHGVRIRGEERKIQLSPTEIKKYGLQQEDLLVVRVNGSRQIAGLFIVYEGRGETYCDHFIRIVLDRSLALPEFIKYAANCREGRDFIEMNLVTSAGQNTISQATLSELPINLPPLSEQQEIVRRVEALLRFADQIEARYQKAKTHVDKLIQSILAKAFCGELVPQNPEDEPAAMLLERIRKEQDRVDSQSRKTQRRSLNRRPGLV